jgi:hypothetical protein
MVEKKFSFEKGLMSVSVKGRWTVEDLVETQEKKSESE